MEHEAAAVLGGVVGQMVHRVVRYEDGPIGLLLAEQTEEGGQGGGGVVGGSYSYLHVIAGAWRLTEAGSVLDGSYHEGGPDTLTYADRIKQRVVDGFRLTETADGVVSLSGLQLLFWCAAAKEPCLMWYRPGREALVVYTGNTWTQSVLDADDPLREVGDLAIELAEYNG